MVALWFEYVMQLVAMLALIGAGYYWWQASKVDLPAPESGEAGTAQALLRLADSAKRAAGLSALGAVLVVAAYLMGVYAAAA